MIHVISRIRPVGRPSCEAKTLTLDITRKPFNHFFFIPAMLIGTIDFHHFIPLLLTLTALAGHKVSAKQTSWLHFLAHFPTDRVCVIHWHCTAQLSMFNMEKRYRNKIIIIIIIIGMELGMVLPKF